jgi:hypothetical protein
MPVNCTSPLAPSPQSTRVPGRTTLSLTVAVSDDVKRFIIDYVIVDPKVAVSFPGGATVKRVQVTVTDTVMTVRTALDLVCRKGDQLKSFHIEAQVFDRGVMQCVPAPRCAIGVIGYDCPATLKALPGKAHVLHAELVDEDLEADVEVVPEAGDGEAREKPKPKPKRKRARRADD